MAQDPYQVLGVARSASSEEIRAAYRRLAKQYHPDRNPGDARAEDRFKGVSAAFDIIGDAEKKRRFDRGEIDADGNERTAQGYGGGAGPFGGAGPNAGFDDVTDIFGEFFGGRGGARGPRRPRAQRGKDIRYRLGVDFLDAARGTVKRVVLGNGRGVDVRIPEGLRDGQTLRLQGKGEPGVNGGPAGDVLVEVSVRAHPAFKLSGDDLTLEVPVTLREAVLGARIEVPTLKGVVAIKLPENTSSGVSLRIKGKGIKDPRAGNYGDLYAKIRIVLPEPADQSLKDFVKEWGPETKDPRADLLASAET